MKNNNVNKPNAMIQAGQNLTAPQAKMLFSMLSRFRNLIGNGTDLDELANIDYIFPISDFMPQFEKHQGGRAYDLVKKHVSSMVQQSLTVKKGKSTKYYNLISYAEVIEGSSNVTARFNSDVLSLLIDMHEEGYTRIAFKDVYRMKSAYSIRIYELLQRHREHPKVVRTGKYEVSLEDLRFYLGIDAKKYPRWVDFRKRIVDVAVAEIEEKTDLRFTLEYIRTGRKITGLAFGNIALVSSILFDDKTAVEQVELSLDPKEAVQQSFSNPLLEGIIPDHRIEIEKQHSPEYIEYYFKKVKALESRGRLKSDFPACLFTYIKKDADNFYELEARKKADREERKRQEMLIQKAANDRQKQRDDEHAKTNFLFQEAKQIFDNLSEDARFEKISSLKNAMPFLPENLLYEEAVKSYAKDIGIL